MSTHVPALPPAQGGDASPPLLLAVASVATASTALALGADIVDLGDQDPRAVDAFVAGHPGARFLAADHRAALTCHAELARAGGPALVCADLAAARASGLPPARLIVRARPGEIEAVTAHGLAVLVDADGAEARAWAGRDRPDEHGSAELAGIAATAALACWLGAAVVRTAHPLAARRAIDMTASIRGIRPPARTVRGLA